MNLHFSTGKLLSVCVCCSLLGGRAVGCIMQEVGDEPSQEGGCVEMRHSMTCFRRACIIQHRPSNSLSCLSHCRVFTVENIWKIRLFPTRESVQLCAAATPPLVSQNTSSITSTHPESCILPGLLPPQILPCHPILLNPPLLADWNASYQIQTANVGWGSVPHACWCSAVTKFRSKFIYKACLIQMSLQVLSHKNKVLRFILNDYNDVSALMTEDHHLNIPPCFGVAKPFFTGTLLKLRTFICISTAGI